MELFGNTIIVLPAKAGILTKRIIPVSLASSLCGKDGLMTFRLKSAPLDPSLFWCIIDVEQQDTFQKRRGITVFIEIDPSQPQPIFEQVTLQIKFAVAAGTIRTDEMIPSVRELSRQLAINPNTVVRAYRELQDENILAPRRGIGLVVTEHAQTECQKQRKECFQQRFKTFLQDAARSGLSQKELDEILTK